MVVVVAVAAAVVVGAKAEVGDACAMRQQPCTRHAFPAFSLYTHDNDSTR